MRAQVDRDLHHKAMSIIICKLRRKTKALSDDRLWPSSYEIEAYTHSSSRWKFDESLRYQSNRSDTIFAAEPHEALRYKLLEPTHPHKKPNGTRDATLTRLAPDLDLASLDAIAKPS